MKFHIQINIGKYYIEHWMGLFVPSPPRALEAREQGEYSLRHFPNVLDHRMLLSPEL